MGTASISAGSAKSPDDGDLYLAVTLNGSDTGRVVRVRQKPVGCLAVEAKALAELQIKVPPSDPGTMICTTAIPGVTRAKYDASAQTLALTLGETARQPQVFDASQVKRTSETPEAPDFSAVFNYTLFAGFAADEWGEAPGFRTASATFDTHVYTPAGTLDQSAIFRTLASDPAIDVIRLDTRWSYENPASLTTVAAGDVISGGLSWTRSLRLGGVQVRKDFALRPDLVTTPTASLSGSAAVPSTVEVYANQSRLFAKDVDAGPFTIANLSTMTGPGTMRLVVKDASGRETVSEYAFYSSSQLLAPGLVDYSVEAGFARRFFGTLSDAYDENPVGSASFRYGLSPALTLEGHAEGGAGVINGGGGISAGLSHYAVAGVSLSGSQYGSRTGGQVSASIETALWDAKIFARSIRTFGEFDDLVSATADRSSFARRLAIGTAPYRRQDQIAVSVPIPATRGSMTVSYVSGEQDDGHRYQIASAGYAQPFVWENSTLSVNAFSDLLDRSNYGAFATLSFTAKRTTFAASLEATPQGISAGASAVEPVEFRPGSFGYSVATTQGAREEAYATATYRASAIQVSAGLRQAGKSSQFTAQADGAVAVLNGVHVSNRIEGAFAVVETGLPGVRVLQENRDVGVTDASGRLFLPALLARDANALALDPATIPIEAEIEDTLRTVTPPGRGGITVKYKSNPAPAAAIVAFVDAEGKPLPAGSDVNATGASPSTIGYDGEAYLTGLQPQNTVQITTPSGAACTARFSFTRRKGQVRIDAVPCLEPRQRQGMS
jgi:outer membrane usher protein